MLLHSGLDEKITWKFPGSCGQAESVFPSELFRLEVGLRPLERSKVIRQKKVGQTLCDAYIEATGYGFFAQVTTSVSTVLRYPSTYLPKAQERGKERGEGGPPLCNSGLNMNQRHLGDAPQLLKSLCVEQNIKTSSLQDNATLTARFNGSMAQASRPNQFLFDSN